MFSIPMSKHSMCLLPIFTAWVWIISTSSMLSLREVILWRTFAKSASTIFVTIFVVRASNCSALSFCYLISEMTLICFFRTLIFCELNEYWLAKRVSD